MVSVFYFTPLPGFFSPFPLGTCSLSVTREYLALRNGLRSFRQDSTCPALLRILQEPSVFRLQDFHPLRFNFPVNSTILMVSYSYIEVLQPQIRRFGLGSSPFARHYLGNRFFFLFLRLLRCFSSPGCSLYSYVFTIGWQSVTTAGFPHSEISGSKRTYCSPKHIVVRHVLLQLLVPRHPPCALTNLTTLFLDISIS